MENDSGWFIVCIDRTGASDASDGKPRQTQRVVARQLPMAFRPRLAKRGWMSRSCHRQQGPIIVAKNATFPPRARGRSGDGRWTEIGHATSPQFSRPSGPAPDPQRIRESPLHMIGERLQRHGPNPITHPPYPVSDDIDLLTRNFSPGASEGRGRRKRASFPSCQLTGIQPWRGFECNFPLADAVPLVPRCATLLFNLTPLGGLRFGACRNRRGDTRRGECGLNPGEIVSITPLYERRATFGKSRRASRPAVTPETGRPPAYAE